MLKWNNKKSHDPQHEGKFFDLAVVYPRVTIQSDREVLIEGCLKMLVYHEHLICVGAKNMEISFWGSHLTIHTINDQNMILTGQLERVEYTRR